jgi:hypothetical protein
METGMGTREGAEVRNSAVVTLFDGYKHCLEPGDLTPRAFLLSKSTKFCGFKQAIATVNLVKLPSGSVSTAQLLISHLC